MMNIESPLVVLSLKTEENEMVKKLGVRGIWEIPAHILQALSRRSKEVEVGCESNSELLEEADVC
jgi:hypothetical protein